MDLVNRHGRTLDDLDMVKMRVFAREQVPQGSFSVQSSDGVPITGFHAGDGSEVVVLTAREWSSRSGNAAPC